MKHIVLATLLALTANVMPMNAGGFQLNDHSARGVGMGFAVLTEPRDASTIYFNPAGMTYLPAGFHVSGGLALIAPGATFAGPTSANRFDKQNLETWVFPIPHLYAAWNSGEGLAAGVGVFVPFGLGTLWDEEWKGRHLAVRTYVETITINPNVAYSFLDDAVSVAAGATISFGRAELRQRINVFEPEPLLDLVGTGTSISWNAGLMAKPTEKLTLGATYRHNINMEYRGDATFTVDDALRPLFQDGPGGTALNLPFDLRFGASYKFTDNLTIEASVDYVGWSSYDTLRIDFDKAPGNPSTSTTRINPRNYRDAFTYRIGGEYCLEDGTALRAGAFFDAVPVDAEFTQPILPDANRIGLSVGAGFALSESLSVDVGYLFIYGLQREVKGSEFNFDGVYSAWANIGCVTFNYKF